MPTPRVAFFPDSFHEVNGVAHTSRNFLAYATRHNLPFLCIRAAPPALHKPHHQTEGPIETLDLPRSRASIGLERDLSFDPLFARHAPFIERTLRAFRPDIIHITGPSELGIFGAFYAWKHKIPLAASWHTNVHEYAAQRLTWLTSRLNAEHAPRLHRRVEHTTLAATTRFYRLAQTLFAPNPDLCRMLEAATHRPCHLMQRGVDTQLFSPTHRTRPHNKDPFTLGYVGRLSVEKNVALLPRIARDLASITDRPIQFVLIGHGAEEPALRHALPEAIFPGVLRGPALAEAYANMDLFLFPSHTDTFGNVVLEALASGVPALVTPDGGPKYIVHEAITGHIVPDDHFAPTIATLLTDPQQLATMRCAARTQAETCSWDAVFQRVYAAYPQCSYPNLSETALPSRPSGL